MISQREKLVNKRIFGSKAAGTPVRLFSVILLPFVCLTFLAFPSFAQAQTKYTPAHPDVKAMADRAIAFLQNAKGKAGYSAIAALAIVEHSKRYDKAVPTGNEFVNNVIKQIRQKCDDGNSFHRENEVYYPAVALILLAEFDAAGNHDQIVHLLDVIKKRQNKVGGYNYLKKGNSGASDCSQTQFAGLAMWVAKSHGFDVDISTAKNTLLWFCSVAQNGQWSYMYKANGRPERKPTLSMQAAGISSVYLLADLLQLTRRVFDVESAVGSAQGLGLPKTVKIYVPPKKGQDKGGRPDQPLTDFNKSLLGNTVGAGNRSFDNAFTYKFPQWNYYYLYALERYCYFRKQAEGNLGSGNFKSWYDGGVKFLKGEQAENGSFSPKNPKYRVSATAFAVLFLVRSSEIISLPPAEGEMAGGTGFGSGVLSRSDNAKIVSSEAEQNLGAMIALLKDNEKLSSEQLERINESLKKQIVEFRNEDEKSRAKVQAFLRSMVGAKNYYRRLIAVRFLAGEQDMDNVPGLIYAVSDPDFRIAFEAHQGLRLMSRKIDSMKLSQTTIQNARRDPGPLKKHSPQIVNLMRSEFNTMEKRWSEWFLKIRPNAELFNQAGSEIEGVAP